MPSFVLGLVLGCLTPTIVLAWLLWRHRRTPALPLDVQEELAKVYRRRAGLDLDADSLELDWSGPTPPAAWGTGHATSPQRIRSSLHTDPLANSQLSTHQAESSATPARSPVAAQTPATPPTRHDDASSSVPQEYPRTFSGRCSVGLSAAEVAGDALARHVWSAEWVEAVGSSWHLRDGING